MIAARKSAESAAVPQPKPAAAPAMSFRDFVEAARARREGREVPHASEDPVGPRRPELPRLLGSNGIFQILSLGVRNAEFSFRGWQSEYSTARREVFEVDAGVAGDVRLAVVRKIIDIIRRYYDGNFNWQSQRLGRVVVLSARMQDENELESFLMQEFFTSNQ